MASTEVRGLSLSWLVSGALLFACKNMCMAHTGSNCRSVLSRSLGHRPRQQLLVLRNARLSPVRHVCNQLACCPGTHPCSRRPGSPMHDIPQLCREGPRTAGAWAVLALHGRQGNALPTRIPARSGGAGKRRAPTPGLGTRGGQSLAQEQAPAVVWESILKYATKRQKFKCQV